MENEKLNDLDDELARAIISSKKFADEDNSRAIKPEHILIELLSNNESTLSRLFDFTNINRSKFVEFISAKRMKAKYLKAFNQLRLDADSIAIIKSCTEEKNKLDFVKINSLCFFLTYLKKFPERTDEFFAKHNLNSADFLIEMRKLIKK